MISVIIPALNEAKALPKTLAKLLAQDGHYEIILVDGGSDDDTLAIGRAHKWVQVLKASCGRVPPERSMVNFRRAFLRDPDHR